MTVYTHTLNDYYLNIRYMINKLKVKEELFYNCFAHKNKHLYISENTIVSGRKREKI